MKLAWIQGKSQKTLKANLDYYKAQIIEAAKSKPDLVVLPELCLSDYFAITQNPENFKYALELGSNELKELFDLAKQLKIFLHISFFEKVSSAIFYNSSLVISNQGELISHYRKMHIPDDPGFNEKYYFSPGDLGFVVAKIPQAKLGLLICWDQWFPEAARINALKGAQILIYPTAIAWDAKEDPVVYAAQLEAWTRVMQGHAIANNVFVLAVNRCGQEGHLNFWGASVLIDPWGKILKQENQDEVISSHVIDLAEIESARRIWPYFRDRRIDAYNEITKKWSE